jgi:putative ATPase
MANGELFPTSEETQAPRPPLARRMTPKDLEEFEGQEHLLAEGKPLRRAIEADRLGSAIFFGPPGTGKSALANLAAKVTGARVVEVNAVTAGVQELRKILDTARYNLARGERTLLLLDEIHHFNRSQQDVLLPAVEKGDVTLVGLTTENPGFYVNSALLSRSTLYEFNPLTDGDLRGILKRSLSDKERGLGGLSLSLEPEAEDHLVRYSNGDARRLLNALEIAAATTRPDAQGVVRVTLGVAEESLQKRAVRYDKASDDHYDHISAFIKSMRGSDPDAAVYWMAKMLAAGEDPRFIARRILICASEDVGNADPQALVVAAAALTAVEFVGMPEARIPLSQAALYVACAPKSNAAYLAVDGALAEVERGPSRSVPLHLRDANLDAESRGHGKGYLYPHDFPGHHVAQQYLPDPKTFYSPSDQGQERTIAERLAAWNKRRREKAAKP